MSLIRKHGAVLQAWACLALVILSNAICSEIDVEVAQRHNGVSPFLKDLKFCRNYFYPLSEGPDNTSIRLRSKLTRMLYDSYRLCTLRYGKVYGYCHRLFRSRVVVRLQRRTDTYRMGQKSYTSFYTSI